jgi:alkylmercury lyase
VAGSASRQQVVEALDGAFPVGRDARSLLRAITRLLARGAPVPAHDLARALDWSPARVEAALAALPSCERDDNGDVIGAGLSLSRGPHLLEIGRRRFFAARTMDVLVLAGLIDRDFVVSCSCTATGARIRIGANALGLGEGAPCGVVAFVPGPLQASLRGAPADARLFRSKGDAEPWVSVGPRGTLLSLKSVLQIGADFGRRAFTP